MQMDLQKFRLWLPVIVWLAIIFSLSHQPKVNLAPVQPSAFIPEQSQNSSWLMISIDWDTVVGKGAHLVVFGILAFLLWRVDSRWHFVLGGVLLIGLTDEFHQLFIDGRTGRVMDVFIDVLGGGIALFIIKTMRLPQAVIGNKLLNSG